MASLDSDQTYRELRKEITDKAFLVNIYDVATMAMAAGAFALAVFGGPLSGLAVAGAIALGAGAAGLGIVSFRKRHDLALDYEELDIKRRSDYLEKVVEKSQGQAPVLALDSQLAAGKDKSVLGMETSWADRVSIGDLAAQATDMHRR